MLQLSLGPAHRLGCLWQCPWSYGSSHACTFSLSAVSQPVRPEGLRKLKALDTLQHFIPCFQTAENIFSKPSAPRKPWDTQPPPGPPLHLRIHYSPSQHDWDNPHYCSFRLLLCDIFQYLLYVTKDTSPGLFLDPTVPVKQASLGSFLLGVNCHFSPHKIL